MSTVQYTADLHLNHTFVAATRGYDSSEAHDENLIETFNNGMHKNDHLWILGDVFMGSVTEGLEKVARLKGVKHLVLGNHDAAHPSHRRSHNHMRRFLEVFESVHLHEQHRYGEHKVNLSHFPYTGDHADREDRYTQWRLRDEGVPLLHGHVHAEWLSRGNQINVGVDKWNRPIDMEEALNWMVEF